jgi:hypothetical protein
MPHHVCDDRWQSVRKIPFHYNGTDEPALVERALSLTRDAENQLLETLAAVRGQREKLEWAILTRANLASSAKDGVTK